MNRVKQAQHFLQTASGSLGLSGRLKKSHALKSPAAPAAQGCKRCGV
ncbi:MULTISPECIES: hypothetical protein [Neisseria]|nr:MULTISPECIES: hypothetical protein [Neisseria]MBF0803942.1 hypothetical protein [Neisseria sp. 19428wB4_WF04]